MLAAGKMVDGPHFSSPQFLHGFPSAIALNAPSPSPYGILAPPKETVVPNGPMKVAWGGELQAPPPQIDPAELCAIAMRSSLVRRSLWQRRAEAQS